MLSVSANKIVVKVIEARNLKASAIGGTSDPHCKLQLHSRVPTTANIQKSQIIKKTLSPRWDQEFTFMCPQPANDYLSIDVYDHDRIGRDDPLGKVVFNVSSVEGSGFVDIWLDVRDFKNINKIGRGQLHIAVTYFGEKTVKPSHSERAETTSPSYNSHCLKQAHVKQQELQLRKKEPVIFGQYPYRNSYYDSQHRKQHQLQQQIMLYKEQQILDHFHRQQQQKVRHTQEMQQKQHYPTAPSPPLPTIQIFSPQTPIQQQHFAPLIQNQQQLSTQQQPMQLIQISPQTPIQQQHFAPLIQNQQQPIQLIQIPPQIPIQQQQPQVVSIVQVVPHQQGLIQAAPHQQQLIHVIPQQQPVQVCQQQLQPQLPIHTVQIIPQGNYGAETPKISVPPPPTHILYENTQPQQNNQQSQQELPLDFNQEQPMSAPPQVQTYYQQQFWNK